MACARRVAAPHCGGGGVSDISPIVANRREWGTCLRRYPRVSQFPNSLPFVVGANRNLAEPSGGSRDVARWEPPRGTNEHGRPPGAFSREGEAGQ